MEGGDPWPKTFWGWLLYLLLFPLTIGILQISDKVSGGDMRVIIASIFIFLLPTCWLVLIDAMSPN